MNQLPKEIISVQGRCIWGVLYVKPVIFGNFEVENIFKTSHMENTELLRGMSGFDKLYFWIDFYENIIPLSTVWVACTDYKTCV